MAKSATIKDNKWVGTIFEHEDLVDLMIPLDPLNKSKHMFVCINGQEVYVARGTKTKHCRTLFRTLAYCPAP